MQKNRHLIWIPVGLIGVFALGMMVYEFICSLFDYNFLRPLFDSTFRGLNNFSYIFNYNSFWLSLVNALVQGLMTILPSMVLGLGITCLLGLIPNRVVKAALAGGALLVALVPTIIWENQMKNFIVGIQQLIYNSGLSRDIPGIRDAVSANLVLMLTNLIPMLGLSVFAGLSLSMSTNTPVWKAALAACLIPATTLFLPDMRANYLVNNPLVANEIQTPTYLIYNMGLLSMRVSRSMAMSTLCRLLSMVIAVLPMLLLGNINKRAAALPRRREDGHSWAFELLAALGMGFVVMIIMLLCSLPSNFVSSVSIERGVFNTLIISIVTVPIAFVFCFMVISLSRQSSSGIAFGLLSMLLMLMSTFMLSGYMLQNKLGMQNTYFSLIFSALGNPVFLTVLILLAAQRPVTWRQTFFLAVGAALIAAACCAGDYLPSMLSIYSSSMKPLSSVFQQTLSTNSSMMTEFSNSSSRFTAQADIIATPQFLLMLISLLIALPGVALVMGGVGGSRPGMSYTGNASSSAANTNNPLGLYRISLVKYILLPMFTFGIYQWVCLCRMMKSCRNIAGKDPSIVGEFLLYFFVPFYNLYWLYTRSRDFAYHANAKGYMVSDHSALYLILTFFGFGWVAMLLMQNDINNVADASLYSRAQY